MDPVTLQAARPMPLPEGAAWRRAVLRFDAGLRLGPRPAALWLGHRLLRATGVLERRLGDAPVPAGPFLPRVAPPAPDLPPGSAARVLDAAGRADAAPGHGGYDPAAPALALDLFAGGDIRAVWEANRLGTLPLLAQAARLQPEAGFLARAETLLSAWSAANPPFRGPNWACGQEAAFRILHLALALALLDADRDPPAGARAFLALHARRIAATRLYARAQDNNHPISEAAGLLVAGLLLRDAAMAAAAARDLARLAGRLVAEDGAFAQPSPQYHRLLLDTLSLAAVFARRHGLVLPPPFAARAAAATRWLHRVAMDGALPRIGHGDDSAIADLSLRGPQDARGSIERAARLFCDASGGAADDSGCAWLGLPAPVRQLDAGSAWTTEGWRGWRAEGAQAVLRTGAPLRFRPTQCDLLHLDLWDGARNILRDGGTGAYNPPPRGAHWPEALWTTAAHNTIAFDDDEQMPRAGRFLLARWPRARLVEHGAALRDHTGRRHERRVHVQGRVWTIEDRVAGPFRALALRWRLPPASWRLAPDGVDGAAARIVVTADAPLRLALRPGLESLAYGEASPAPVLEARAAAPVSRLVTTVLLPPR
jgi:hypothetical protein